MSDLRTKNKLKLGISSCHAGPPLPFCKRVLRSKLRSVNSSTAAATTAITTPRLLQRNSVDEKEENNLSRKLRYKVCRRLYTNGMCRDVPWRSTLRAVSLGRKSKMSNVSYLHDPHSHRPVTDSYHFTYILVLLRAPTFVLSMSLY